MDLMILVESKHIVGIVIVELWTIWFFVLVGVRMVILRNMFGF